MSRSSMRELEIQAQHERENLQNSIFELRDHIRESVSPSKVVQAHLALACLLAGLMGFAVGYLLAGRFTGK